MFGVLQLAGFWAAPGLLFLPVIVWIMWSRIRMRYLKPVNVGALNTLKGHGLLVRAETKFTLLDFKRVRVSIIINYHTYVIFTCLIQTHLPWYRTLKLR